MFPVSEKFKNAIRQNTRRYEWSGSITTKGGRVYKFSSKDIVKGSGYIKRQCCNDTEIELGTVYSAEMGISLFSDIDRYTLNDSVVRLYYSLELSDGATETIPMGIFDVTEANRKIKTLELKGYDFMLRFDKTLKLESSSGTPFQFLKTACDACKVEMAQTVAEINALLNGKTTLGIYSDNDIETFRDLIFYVAQVLGCFCQIDRYGRLILKQYGNSPVWTVPQKERFDSSYSDFVTRYTAVSSTNMITQTAEYIAVETDDALTMNLGVNPLMQFGVKSVRKKMLIEILNDLQKVNYVPFDSTTIGNPALEPGDVLKFTGGHADDEKISCITSIEYKIYGKQSLKCVGKNPRLANSKSKNEKNIAGLLNSVEKGKTVIYSFVNVSPFTIEQSFTKVIDIDFTATEETSASFQCEMLLEVIKSENDESNELPELNIIYKMNDETIDNFMPAKTCLVGKHIVTLFYPISKVIENSSNTFSMYLKISKGSMSIGEAQIRATISGQGLAAGIGDWNGRININENIGNISVDNMTFVADTFADTMEVTLPALKKSAFRQSIGNIQIPQYDFTIDAFAERNWLSEILRTFVLTSVRGKPTYSNFITINSSEQFILSKTYISESEPYSIDNGFAEKLTVDTDFLEDTQNVEVKGSAENYRKKFIVSTLNSMATVPDEVDTSNKRFELKAVTETTVKSVPAEIDEGFMECLQIDIHAFDGVKGVEINL